MRYEKAKNVLRMQTKQQHVFIRALSVQVIDMWLQTAAEEQLT